MSIVPVAIIGQFCYAKLMPKHANSSRKNTAAQMQSIYVNVIFAGPGVCGFPSHSFMFDDVEMKLEKQQPLVVHDRIVHELIITLMIRLMPKDKSSLFK